MLFYNIYWVVLQQTAFHEGKPSSFQTMLVNNLGLIREFTQYNYVYFSTLTVFLAYIAYSAPVLFKTLGKRRTPFLFASMFLRLFTQFGYLYFSTFTILLAYVGCAKPLFFQTLLRRRNVILLVTAGHLWTTIAVFTMYPRTIPDLFIEHSSDLDLSAFMLPQLIIVLALYMAMVVLYVLALLQMRKNVLHTSRSYSITKANRNMLKSVVIYCTPPNIFAALALPIYVYNTIVETTGVMRPSSSPPLSNDDLESILRLYGTFATLSQGTSNVIFRVSTEVMLLLAAADVCECLHGNGGVP
ncbi:hypothetical protein QR680_004019 [Steinernema hermaphroditum]|uniref:Uncharacterized protein n=1 Tax=Steinernema hermaphroditum TaxID=289476 RepID=A0AA39HME1_9BILA|nr:hypothetical protein QR680_004019 [Steinernema hermaphroditum]